MGRPPRVEVGGCHSDHHAGHGDLRWLMRHWAASGRRRHSRRVPRARLDPSVSDRHRSLQAAGIEGDGRLAGGLRADHKPAGGGHRSVTGHALRTACHWSRHRYGPTGIRTTDPVTWTNPENGRSVVLPFRGMKLQGPQCDGQRNRTLTLRTAAPPTTKPTASAAAPPADDPSHAGSTHGPRPARAAAGDQRRCACTSKASQP